MKTILILVIGVYLLPGCAQLTKGELQLQPVIAVDGNHGMYSTTCSGAVEDWGSCFAKARKTCSQGYEVVKKTESPVAGRREFTFKCN